MRCSDYVDDVVAVDDDNYYNVCVCAWSHLLNVCYIGVYRFLLWITDSKTCIFTYFVLFIVVYGGGRNAHRVIPMKHKNALNSRFCSATMHNANHHNFLFHARFNDDGAAA